MARDSEMSAGRRKRVLRQLVKMTASGRLTEEEATRLRAAAGPSEFDDVVRDISVRHADARLAAAVADCSMSQEEADAFLSRLRSGEHPRSLRSHLGALRRGARMPPPGSTRPAGESQDEASR
jgi:hypothetical protein